MSSAEDRDGSRKQRDRHDDVGLPAERMSPEMASNSIAATSQEVPVIILNYFDTVKLSVLQFLVEFI